MQFVLMLAVLGALSLSEYGPAEPVAGATGRLMIAVGAMALVALFAQAVSVTTARRVTADPAGRPEVLDRFRRLRRVHVVVWLAAAAAVYWLGWGQMVRFNWQLDGTFLLDDLLILVPALMPMMLSWAAFYEVDRAARTAMAGDGTAAIAFPTRRRYVGLHVRHYLGVLLVPVLVLLAISDGLQLLAPGWLETENHAAVLLPTLLSLFLLFPFLLRYLWAARPLQPGPLRDRLEQAARRVGFRARDILVWHTDNMVVNAAVAGFLPPLRYVFLSDGLLQRLTDEEIEAVFGHEVGHVHHFHLLLRVLTITAPLSLWLLARQVLPDATERFDLWFEEGGAAWQAQMGLVALAAMAAYILVVFGLYSRMLEHQADLFACRFGSPVPSEPAAATFVAALEKLAPEGRTSRKVRGWQHASIARRVEFLDRLCGSRTQQRWFRRRMRLLGGLVVATSASPILYQLLLVP